ncbi:MAG: hypothetical protein R3280_08120 [Marinobacter sp.]|uniref:hypothetical protein n=1 Tax=Marinobacter sp. TaxID=50741 RepID=UPI00299DACF0|nr:hypothetical protein [Marinobacter sp.]MDX1634586.1 hypothetical protein [Marinobacter sp.]
MTSGAGLAYPGKALAALLLAGLVFALLTGPAAARDCSAMARTDYERLYCRLVNEGHGAGLPAFEDFRRNTPRVQALLLKRPAQRAGLELPDAPEARPATPARPDAPRQRPEAPPAATRQAEQQTAVTAPALADCELLGEVIQCPDRRLELVDNLPNRALAPDALADSQRLDLPAFQGDPADGPALRRYLSDAYDHYLQRMLDIGLGGATMSFSQFYRSYFRHRDQGVDFTERMEATFQYLRQDKLTKAVPARLHSRLPDDIDACTPIKRQLVVCDNGVTNWVYQGTERQP